MRNAEWAWASRYASVMACITECTVHFCQVYVIWQIFIPKYSTIPLLLIFPVSPGRSLLQFATMAVWGLNHEWQSSASPLVSSSSSSSSSYNIGRLMLYQDVTSVAEVQVYHSWSCRVLSWCPWWVWHLKTWAPRTPGREWLEGKWNHSHFEWRGWVAKHTNAHNSIDIYVSFK